MGSHCDAANSTRVGGVSTGLVGEAAKAGALKFVVSIGSIGEMRARSQLAPQGVQLPAVISTAMRRGFASH